MPKGARAQPGDRRTTRDGYVLVKGLDGLWRREHRVIAEEMLGRSLGTDEHVHHKNRIRSDNRPENLEVMDGSAHMRYHRIHAGKRRTWAIKSGAYRLPKLAHERKCKCASCRTRRAAYQRRWQKNRRT